MKSVDEFMVSVEPGPAHCPVCPRCKTPLIARHDHRRFIEDNIYVECLSGHVWQLSEIEVTDPLQSAEQTDYTSP